MSDYFKHESAYVDDGASVGDGTKIWHFAHVMSGAQIGSNCIFGQNTMVASGVRIGSNVKVQNNVAIYTGTIIEDFVFLGPSCVLTNVNNPRSEINRHSLYEKTVIKRGATIGANATIVCGTTVGRYAFIAAGATVTKDVPDYGLVAGVPGKRIGWMSRHGHKLDSPDADGIMTCPESGLGYREESDGRLRCIDLDEKAEMPQELAKAEKSYSEWKAGR
jgi:UDP-2-acetamido-3-amino-2,3-dideoxy-glucuronate N-acetyltransferase